MAGMSRNASAVSLQGFSVCQPALGAALQFLPALGTPELDTLIDAFLPGPASLKDKRATVCMDFCEYARQTGESFKFYPVYTPAAATASASPASTMYDSGYGSNFDASPATSDLTWSRTASFATPTAAPVKRKASVASARAVTNDFSHLPGMKIMTKDGQDVTNSASRGCKTKEQRDHAHLMRIIKACDACRRKKIRCDPAHRKRTAVSPSEAKPSKKAKKAAVEPRIETVEADTSLLVGNASFQWEEATPAPALDQFCGLPDETWDQFVQYDDEPFLQGGYDFFSDPQNYFSPSSGASASPAQPFTPAPPAPLGVDVYGGGSLFPEFDNHQATLPYLVSGSHGTDYVDFNLYSPASSFLDEEPQTFQAKARGTKQEQSRGTSPSPQGSRGSSNTVTANGLEVRLVSSPHAESYFCGCSDDQPPTQAVSLPDPGWGGGQGLRHASTEEQGALMPSSPRNGSPQGSSGSIAKPTASNFPTSGPAKDAATQSTASVASPPPNLQPVKRCGKDGHASATWSQSPLFTGSSSAAPTGASHWTAAAPLTEGGAWHASTAGERQPSSTMVLATIPTTDVSVVNSVERDNHRNLDVVFVHGLSGRGQSTWQSTSDQPWETVPHRTSTVWSGFDQASQAVLSVLSTQSPRVEGLAPAGQAFLVRGATEDVSLVSHSGLFLMAILLLFTLPVRHIADGTVRSNTLWLLLSLLVGLGLVSFVSGHLVPSLSSDLLSKLPAVALSLVPVAIQHHSSSKSVSVPASVAIPKTALRDTIDNVKSKLQRASAAVNNLRCMLSRRLQRGHPRDR